MQRASDNRPYAARSASAHQLENAVNQLLMQHHASLMHEINKLMTQHSNPLETLDETFQLHESVTDPSQTSHQYRQDQYCQDTRGGLKVCQTASKTAEKVKINALAMAKGWVKKHTTHAEALYNARRELEKSRMAIAQRVVKSGRFQHLSGFIILLNCIVLGIEADHMGRTGDVPMWVDVLNIGFVAIFTLELALQIIVEGSTFLQKHLAWKVLDSFVVALSLIELFYRFVVDGNAPPLGQSTILRMLKILMIAKTLRAVRALYVFHDLRLMMECILHSVRLLVWAVFLTMLLVYGFSIVFTMAISQHKSATGDSIPEIVTTDSEPVLQQVVLALFESLFGGTSWSEFSRPLGRISWAYEVIFLGFVIISNLLLLNVVTGVVVQGSMSAAARDRDLLIQAQLKQESSHSRELTRLFKEADLDDGGQLTQEQLESLLKDDRVVAFMRGLDVDVGEALGLFNLLDTNNDGTVDAREFTLGCMRLKGPAKNIDVATILFENKKLATSINHRFKEIHDALNQLAYKLAAAHPTASTYQVNAFIDFSEQPVGPPPSANPSATFRPLHLSQQPGKIAQHL